MAHCRPSPRRAAQLFDLATDPSERRDLAPDPAHGARLAAWRRRLIAQFEEEGRGAAWVQGGRLQVRPKGQTYSPNYPGKGEESGAAQ